MPKNPFTKKYKELTPEESAAYTTRLSLLEEVEADAKLENEARRAAEEARWKEFSTQQSRLKKEKEEKKEEAGIFNPAFEGKEEAKEDKDKDNGYIEISPSSPSTSPEPQGKGKDAASAVQQEKQGRNL